MADLASGRSYLTIAQGAADMFERRVVSHRWEDWRGEMLWMSLYFSVAVWISISLIHMLLRRMGSTTVIPAKAHYCPGYEVERARKSCCGSRCFGMISLSANSTPRTRNNVQHKPFPRSIEAPAPRCIRSRREIAAGG
jgi:hypothetical protein